MSIPNQEILDEMAKRLNQMEENFKHMEKFAAKHFHDWTMNTFTISNAFHDFETRLFNIEKQIGKPVYLDSDKK